MLVLSKEAFYYFLATRQCLRRNCFMAVCPPLSSVRSSRQILLLYDISWTASAISTYSEYSPAPTDDL